jgi:hypothetical protein
MRMKHNKTIPREICCEDDRLMNLPVNGDEISHRFCAWVCLIVSFATRLFAAEETLSVGK